jgi:hypothetical protein
MATDEPVTPAPETDGVDPIEFLRRALAISPEDAAEVRRLAAEDAQRGQEGQRGGA